MSEVPLKGSGIRDQDFGGRIEGSGFLDRGKRSGFGVEDVGLRV